MGKTSPKTQENLKRLVAETKRKTWQNGVSGLKLNHPQNIQLVQFPKDASLTLQLKTICRKYQDSENPELKKATRNLQGLADILDKNPSISCEMDYQFKEKRKIMDFTRAKLLHTYTFEEPEELLEKLAKNGYKSEANAIKMKTLFDKKEMQYHLTALVEKIKEEKNDALQLLAKQVVRDVDQLVKQTNKKVEQLQQIEKGIEK